MFSFVVCVKNIKMTLVQRFNCIFLKGKQFINLRTAFIHNDNAPDKVLQELRQKEEKDMPVEMKNPFEKEKPKCLLCQLQIEPDFKNVRLLSQFISRYTGRIYGRHITGLCTYKHNKLLKEIKKSRDCGLMPFYIKSPNYLEDPSLYDPTNPFRPHSY